VAKSGYPLLFLAISLLTLLAFGSSLLVKGTTAPIRGSNSTATGIWSQLLEKNALLPSGVMFFMALVYGAVLSFIALYAAEHGITNIGLFFTAMALTMFTSRPIAGRWTDRGGINMVLLIGHLALFIGMVITGFSHTMTHFLIAGSFIGLGFGVSLPTLQSLAVRHAPAHRRGAATGTFFASLDLGIGLGTILWGYVAVATSYQIMYFTTLIPVIIAGGIYFKFKASARITNISEDPSC
jgi:MFS family permease